MDIFQTPDKKQVRRRRKAMTEEEIAAMKKKLATTPKKTTKKGITFPEEEEPETRRIRLEKKGNMEEKEFQTPLASKKYWDKNHGIWQQKFEQAQIYLLINWYELTEKEMETFWIGIYNFIAAQEAENLEKEETINLRLLNTITRLLPEPTYNVTKGIPWLVRNWPDIQQYLTLGDFYSLSSPELVEEEVTYEIYDAPTETKGKDKEKRQHEQTPELQLLGESGTAREQQEREQNPPEKKETKFWELGPGDPSEPDDSDPDDSDYQPSEKSEKRREEKERRKRSLTPSQQEWEKVTGMKQNPRKFNKEDLQQINKLAKIPNPENMDGKKEKWKNPITFDQWTARTQKWLEY
jgi:hypothetical protein